jgi:transcriptional regulator with XRE-family HTH domain
MAKAPRFNPNFIRAWRKHRHLSLEQLASRVPMDKGNLSKVERSLLPYNQEMLERLAEALGTEPASLLMRDPSAPEPIWSLWDRADRVTRRQIEEVAATLIRTGTSG